MSEWQPIETVPKDGTSIVLLSAAYEADYGPNGKFLHPPKAAIGQWGKDATAWVDEHDRLGGRCVTLAKTGVWFSGGGWFQPNEVTHWMPLPPPPQGTEIPSNYKAECGCLFNPEGEELTTCAIHTEGNKSDAARG